MLKFFRRIRRRFLQSGKFSNYVLYAIGEITLVVIGILIALQINNWNEQRKVKNVEKEYLFNLRTEFQENLKELEQVHESRKKTAAALETVMEHSGSSPKNIPDLELSNCLRIIDDYFSIVFAATTPVLEEIKNSGNLITLSNAELRNHLMLWEQIMDPLLGTQNEYKRYRDDFLDVLIEIGSMNDYGGAAISFPEVDGLDFPNTNMHVLQNRKAGNILWKMRGELHLFEELVYPPVKNHIVETIKLIDGVLE